MLLYDCATAPNPRRVRIFAAEKGIELERREVDLRGGEHLSDAFRALNPGCTVPVLALDDGTAISETVAICRYLEELRPEPLLLGVDAVDRALVTMWQRRVEQDGFLAVAEAFRNASRGFRDHAVTGRRPVPQIPELVERGRQRYAGFLEDLDERLAASDYVAGPRYTIADITALVAMDFAHGTLKIEPTAAGANVRRWYEAISSRPGTAA